VRYVLLQESRRRHRLLGRMGPDGPAHPQLRRRRGGQAQHRGEAPQQGESRRDRQPVGAPRDQGRMGEPPKARRLLLDHRQTPELHRHQVRLQATLHTPGGSALRQRVRDRGDAGRERESHRGWSRAQTCTPRRQANLQGLAGLQPVQRRHEQHQPGQGRRLRGVQHPDEAQAQREQLQGGAGDDQGVDEHGVRGSGLAARYYFGLRGP
jgi:hypothetical protein